LHSGHVFSKISVVVTLIFAAIIAILISLFWNKVTIIGDQEVSVSLWILCALAGAVGSLCTVIFIPFAAFYGRIYTTAMATGMGTSGLAASIISLIQVPEINPPILTVEHYFFVLFGFIVCSLLSAGIISITNFAEMEEKPPRNPEIKNSSEGITRLLIPVDKNIMSIKELIEVLHPPILNQCYISIAYYIFLPMVPYLTLGFNTTVQKQLLFWLPLTGIIFGALGRAITGKFYVISSSLLTVVQILLWIYLVSIVFVQQMNIISPAWGWLSLFCYSAYSFFVWFH
jgi:hypothetical protein